jgi:hypothetical protein
MVEMDLETYAAISADLAEGDAPAGAVLAACGLDDAGWTAAALVWGERIAVDAREGGTGSLAAAFSSAFARAQDARRPLPAMSVEEWGELVAEAQVQGLGRALAVRRLSSADHARLVRHWARALAADPALHARFELARDARESTLLG